MRSVSGTISFALVVCAIGVSVSAGCGKSNARMEGPIAEQNVPSQNGKNDPLNRIPEGEEKEADDNPLDLPVEAKLSGVQLQALAIALNAFQADSLIPEDKRNIDNYNVEIRQSVNYYYAYFAARRTPEDERELREGGETSVGKSVMFVLNKKTMNIQKRYFFQ